MSFYFSVCWFNIIIKNEIDSNGVFIEKTPETEEMTKCMCVNEMFHYSI